MLNDQDWLDIDYRTLFRLRDDTGSAQRRIERENDPDRSPGPRFWLGGCASGNLCGVRADVRDDIAAELARVAASEPPFFDRATPAHLDRYLHLLAPVEHWNVGLVYALPHALRCDAGAGVALIDGDSDAGRQLRESLATHGMPAGLHSMGFRGVDDLWSPWCAAVVGGEVASVAFAARLSDVGAELGVATAPAFRGRGLAAAVTEGWSRLPSLRTRTLFYSTDRDNLASRRVAARLGLALRGTTLRIA
ncbi:GNAT family N-acetyltransferase [Burkholderia pseudomultivorans]|uniref:GNAT family N-acetyltransferase n=1 Tax=Burkholderia pseudomultivorans TaxID=1207504 RepID=UPI00075AB924|nr:GNAT family N-acetyltransferase [Burkholderia pseudomultivorans]AOI88947.1 GNAT family acetyltransferase [Burkholderia pseudomultivorans]KVC36409.1 GNAT family acetyltransferase [Burkholderia pseudomultivorans]KVC37266.1 GNAT family acetyltransferase [Burkholderia pseudomultivorans]MDS0796014.1 GNAT family N-acetyltransferase [Burkholderia pseudomultivorans]